MNAVRRSNLSKLLRVAVILSVPVTAVGGIVTNADAASAVIPKARPTVTSVAASSGPSTGGTEVTVKGSNFSHVVSVTVGGVKGKSLHVSTSHVSLTFTTPAHVVGAVDVRIKTSAGTSAVTSQDTFTYRAYSTLSTGDYHSCALTNGAVHCWGINLDGELGNNTTTSSPTPVSVHGLSHVVSLSSGEYDTCALLDSGRLKCWGANGSDQLGNSTSAISSVPVAVPGITDAVAVAPGFEHTCAIVADGTVRCWGANNYGQLGNGTTSLTNSPTPVKVHGLTHVTSITVNDFFSCATRTDGSIKCWGINTFGQLGDGTTNDSSVPKAVIGASHATMVSAAFNDACALIAGGTVSCWGLNSEGELGNGTKTDSHTAKPVAGLVDVNLLSAVGYGACAAINGHVFCWGDSAAYEIGNGNSSPMDPALTPQAVTSLGKVKEISHGGFHTVVRLPGGSLRAWGLNNNGQIGDGTTTNRPAPVAISG